jgi:hypothetical protein
VTVTRDSKVECWERDIGRIAADVVGLFFSRHVFRAVTAFLTENEDLPPSSFYSYLLSTYGDSQVIGVRRQTDARKQHVSLAGLIIEIKTEPERLTRERFLTTHEFGFPPRTEDDWERNFAGETHEHVDPKLVAADLEELEAATEVTKTWADKRVAHTDTKRMTAEERMTIEKIDQGIDTIGRLFRRYDLLLRGESIVILDWDVKADLLPLFRVPWVRP